MIKKVINFIKNKLNKNKVLLLPPGKIKYTAIQLFPNGIKNIYFDNERN